MRYSAKHSLQYERGKKKKNPKCENNADICHQSARGASCHSRCLVCFMITNSLTLSQGEREKGDPLNKKKTLLALHNGYLTSSIFRLKNSIFVFFFFLPAAASPPRWTRTPRAGRSRWPRTACRRPRAGCRFWWSTATCRPPGTTAGRRHRCCLRRWGNERTPLQISAGTARPGCT